MRNENNKNHKLAQKKRESLLSRLFTEVCQVFSAAFSYSIDLICHVTSQMFVEYFRIGNDSEQIDTTR